MSWYQELAAPAQVWKRRASVSVDNTAGAGGVIDIEFTIPATFDQFWSEIDAAGAELRICDADGTTKLTYALSGFNKTTRAGTFQVDGYTAPAAGMLQLFAYWNSSGAAAGSAAVVIAAPKTGYVQDCGPPPDVVLVTMQRPGDTKPARKTQKGSDETRRIAFDLGPSLQRRRAPSAKRHHCDEIDYATYAVNLAGTPQAAMVTATRTRFYAGRLVIVEIKAGTSASDYTIVVTVRTTEGDTLGARALLQIKDQSET